MPQTKVSYLMYIPQEDIRTWFHFKEQLTKHKIPVNRHIMKLIRADLNRRKIK